MRGARLFLSYASPDRERLRPLYDRLRDEGFVPWVDFRDILPGENWETAIWKAMRAADFLLVFLTDQSAARRGFLQREIVRALELWEEKLEDDIYVVPVRLERCSTPRRLDRFQRVDLFEDGAFDRLVKALEEGLRRRAEGDSGTPEAGVKLERRTLTDVQTDPLRYRIEVTYPWANSNASYARAFNALVQAKAASELVGLRETWLGDGDAPVEWERGEFLADLRATLSNRSAASVSRGRAIGSEGRPSRIRPPLLTRASLIDRLAMGNTSNYDSC